jgi:hypothetical protein
LLDDRKNALQFFLFRDGFGRIVLLRAAGGIYFSARAGRFAAHIDDVGVLGEQLKGVRHGFFTIEKLAPIGEGIGRYVHDSHDQRALAQREHARADIPLENGAHREILNQSSVVRLRTSELADRTGC